MLIWSFTSAAESHCGGNVRGLAQRLLALLFILDTHSRTLCSERAKQKLWPAAWQQGFGKCVIMVLSIMVCRARRHQQLRNSLLQRPLSCLNWSPKVFPPHCTLGLPGSVGRWEKGSGEGSSYRLWRSSSHQGFIWFFVLFCFFNKKFLDFLAESSWVSVLQRSSGCLPHLKIQPKDNIFGGEGLNSVTKRTIASGAHGQTAGLLQRVPAGHSELFLRFFFCPDTGWHRKEAPSPKASSPPEKRWSLQDTGQDELSREPPQWVSNKTYSLEICLFFWTNCSLYVKEKHFFSSLSDSWKLMAR